MGYRGGRPRIKLDREKLLRLRAQGLGTRKIAAELGVSRATVQRELRGMRGGTSNPPAGAAQQVGEASFSSPLLRRNHRRAGRRSRSSSEPLTLEEESERETAQMILNGSAPHSATDKEDVLASWLLEELLDGDPDVSPREGAHVVLEDLRAHVEARTRAEQRAREEREHRTTMAGYDLDSRWRSDAALLRARFHDLDEEDRWRLKDVLDEELQRATKLLERRLEVAPPGADTKALVDHLVEQGLERAALVVDRGDELSPEEEPE